MNPLLCLDSALHQTRTGQREGQGILRDAIATSSAALLVVHIHHFEAALGCKYPKIRGGILLDVKYTICQCCY